MKAGVIIVLGVVLQVIAYILAGFAAVFFGLIPALYRVWTWDSQGETLVISILVAASLFALGAWVRSGRWLRDKVDETTKQKSDGK